MSSVLHLFVSIVRHSQILNLSCTIHLYNSTLTFNPHHPIPTLSSIWSSLQSMTQHHMHPHSQIPTLGHQLSSEQINSAPPVAPVAVELPDFDSADPEPLGADPEPPCSEKLISPMPICFPSLSSDSSQVIVFRQSMSASRTQILMTIVHDSMTFSFEHVCLLQARCWVGETFDMEQPCHGPIIFRCLDCCTQYFCRRCLIGLHAMALFGHRLQTWSGCGWKPTSVSSLQSACTISQPQESDCRGICGCPSASPPTELVQYSITLLSELGAHHDTQCLACPHHRARWLLCYKIFFPADLEHFRVGFGTHFLDLALQVFSFLLFLMISTYSDAPS